MTALWNFILAHQVPIITTLTAAATWLTNVGFSRIISALPAPTAKSTPKYIFWFKFLNNLVGNASRANDTSVESSPNFAAAVNIQNAKVGEEKVVVDALPAKGTP
jgi:hypothetical protein